MDAAQILLDAHVSWVLNQLDGDALDTQIDLQIDRFMGLAPRLRLKDVVKTKDVQTAARQYAIDLELGAVIPELVGDVARLVYRHKVHNDTKLEELIPDDQFEEILDKMLELEALHEALAKHLVANPVFASMISELLQHALRDYAKRGSDMSRKLPGADSAFKIGKKMMDRARPEFGQMLEENLRGFIQKQTEASLRMSESFLLNALESDQIREAILDIWHENKGRSVASIRGFANSLDIEEMFVVGYEYWRAFRQTRYFATLLDAGVQAVMDELGALTLEELLVEIGIDDSMLRRDGKRFVPVVVKALKRKKLLEPVVRANLEGFYTSEHFSQAMAQVLPKD